MRSLINWFFSPNFDRYMMSDHDVSNLADLIISKYNLNVKNDLGIYSKSNKNIELNIPLVKKENYKEHKFLNPVIDIIDLLSKERSPYIKHALIHGSLEDMKYISGWSDLDTWVVISDDIFHNKNQLLGLKKMFTNLNKFLLEIDPISHHGFILLLESDLANYDQSIMPLAVLEKAGSLIESDIINIKIDSKPKKRPNRFVDMKILFEEFNKTGEFQHHPYMGKYLTKDDLNNNEGMYQLKYLVSLIMSVPILYFTEIGKPIYKAESYELFSRSFSKYDDIIYIFSDIRNCWGYYEDYPYAPNKIPEWVTQKIPKDFVEQIILLLTKIEEDLSEKINYKN
jgi:hypothetical protein